MRRHRWPTSSMNHGCAPCSEATGWNTAGATAAGPSATQCLSEVRILASAGGRGRRTMSLRPAWATKWRHESLSRISSPSPSKKKNIWTLCQGFALRAPAHSPNPASTVPSGFAPLAKVKVHDDGGDRVAPARYLHSPSLLILIWKMGVQ